MKSTLKKAFALFTLASVLNQLVFPAVALALTSGPTAPEATSFEPIDTTDMVNPLTGDFTYTLPLIEVPGPEGSYPLTLSYHAGIQPGEEASWVGLGWTLNPGAITRNVNGYPDDWQSTGNITRSYWSGGSTKTIGIDASIWGAVATVNFGLQFSQDTYRGFGVGGYIGGSYGPSFGKYKILSGDITVGISPYGETYSSIGISAGVSKRIVGDLVASGSVGVSTNFSTVTAGVNGGISVRPGKSSFSLLGASMNTAGGGIGLKVAGGISTVNNSNENKVSTETSSWHLGMDFGVFDLGVSYNYVRYWTDETQNITTNGALYSRFNVAVNSDMNNQADDNYYLPDTKNINITDNPEGNRQAGGAFPNTDDYVVSAQGLGGNMKPYDYQTVLFTQNTLDVTDASKNVYQDRRPITSWDVPNSKRQFRFTNDFSNSFTQDMVSYDANSYKFGAANYSPVDQTTGYENTKGYNSNDNRLEGSKHIEYFTNAEIINGTAAAKGFINCKATGFTRVSNAQIGGFMITNSSGVTYHYALPAYSKNEEIYTERISQADGKRWNKLSRTQPYAYTWYLTAVTGPDYVDRGTTGLSDDDWGYWVEYRYGLWTSGYNWRTPDVGYNNDIDNEFKTQSYGSKDLYFLDAIKTRSHTALFEKEIRADGKSGFTGLDNNLNDIAYYKPLSTNLCPVGGGPSGCTQRWSHPTPTLRLKNIYLFKNESLPSSLENMSAAGGVNGHFSYISGIGNPPSQPNSEEETVFNSENVLDVKDGQSAALTAGCIRKTVMNYDYSLAPGTPNSKDPNGTWYVHDPTNTEMASGGKLTLTSVDFQGKAGEQLQPLTEFEYDLDPADTRNQKKFSITSVPGADKRGTITMLGSTTVNDGDILKFTSNNITYYCTVLTAKPFSCDVLYLDVAPTALSNGLTGVLTKNPPYNRDAIDNWGSYKSDYLGGNNENLARRTTAASSAGADVWSLRKIKSSLGNEINIAYEGDTYNRSVLNENRSVIATALSTSGSFPNYFATFTVSNVDLWLQYKVGDNVNAVVYKKVTQSFLPQKDLAVMLSGMKVSEINGNQLKVALPSSEYNKLFSAPDGYNVNQITVTWPTANLSVTNSNLNYGGGIRVKSLSTDDLSGNIYKTNYRYGLPGFESTPSSSGVTAIEPVRFDADAMAAYTQDARKTYRALLYQNMNYLLAIGREVPPPAVYYEYVTIDDSAILPNGNDAPSEGKTLYQYEVFNANMVGIKELLNQKSVVNAGVSSNYAPETYYIYNQIKRNIRLQDFTSRVGAVKRVIIYDNLGKKLKETINHYLHDDLSNMTFDQQAVNYEARMSTFDGVNYNKQGVIQQRFGNARLVATQAPSGGYFLKGDRILLMSSLESYPTIQTGSTQIDYKNGNTVDQKNLAYDYYSGEITKTLTFDSYGNRIINEVVPAYRIPAYAKMGLKTNPLDNNRHMISQKATNYTYSADAANTPTGIISATAQTWSNNLTVLDPEGTVTTTGQNNIWRMSGNSQWMPTNTAANNITPVTNFTSYFAPGGSSNPNWKAVSQITKYNVYSAALEATDIYNKPAATRMGYKSAKVLLTGAPATYNEIAYAGAEDDLLANGNFSTAVSKGTGTVITDSLKSHTGLKSLRVAAAQSGYTYNLPLNQITPGSSYTAAVWVHSESGNTPSGSSLFYKVGTGSEIIPAQTYSKAAAGWFLLELTIPSTVLNGDLVVGCKNSGTENMYFDDFRFQPLTAATAAYVYDAETGELNYALDNNNLFVRYQYDAIGRLVRTYKEVIGKTKAPIMSGVTYNHGKLAKANWQNTGTTQCHLENGNGNGFLDAQQKDINPKSPTYNSTRWVATNTESSSCPKSAYAKLVGANGIVSGAGGYQYSDYVVQFYSDPEKTLPTTLTSSATVNVRITQAITDANNNSFSNIINVTLTASAGQSSVSVGRIILTRCGTNSTSPYVGTSQSPSGGVQPYCINDSVSLLSGVGYL